MKATSIYKLVFERKQRVLFPEVESDPIELGHFYETTIQIGDDKPQDKRLIMPFVTEPSGMGYQETQLGISRLMSRNKNGVLTAFPLKEKKLINPILLLLYPLPFPITGYGMTPAGFFNWYGTEKVKITNIEVCDMAGKLFKGQPYYGDLGVHIAGSYVGREFDGIEICANI